MWARRKGSPSDRRPASMELSPVPAAVTDTAAMEAAEHRQAQETSSSRSVHFPCTVDPCIFGKGVAQVRLSQQQQLTGHDAQQDIL